MIEVDVGAFVGDVSRVSGCFFGGLRCGELGEGRGLY